MSLAGWREIDSRVLYNGGTWRVVSYSIVLEADWSKEVHALLGVSKAHLGILVFLFYFCLVFLEQLDIRLEEGLIVFCFGSLPGFSLN